MQTGSGCSDPLIPTFSRREKELNLTTLPDGELLKLDFDKMIENKLLITVAPDVYLRRVKERAQYANHQHVLRHRCLHGLKSTVSRCWQIGIWP